MLSRVAESLWWLSRNVERAETLARVLDVNYTRTIDHYSGEESLRRWKSVIDVVGMQTELDLIPPASVPATALHYCTFSSENRTSIVSCVRIARQNALYVRSELSSEMWESINGLYLFVESSSPRTMAREGSSSFLHHVRNASQSFGGIVDATLLRDEAWDFLHMGRFFERAYLTARILRGHDPADLVSESQTLLQMCCASEPFARMPHGAAAEPERVIAFLMLDAIFPRSARTASSSWPIMAWCSCTIFSTRACWSNSAKSCAA
jgi:uncharacterized alpha-E superfamily protein